MLDISLGEIILILLIAMAFVGPKGMVEMSKKLGDFFRTLRLSFAEMKEEVTKDEESARAFEEVQNTVHDIANAVNVKKAIRELGTPLLDHPAKNKIDIIKNSAENKKAAKNHNENETPEFPVENTAQESEFYDSASPKQQNSKTKQDPDHKKPYRIKRKFTPSRPLNQQKTPPEDN
jgi:Sec-independent protein translocase protein TatA